MLAALYTGGKLVTGRNHGDAFSKLTEQEKDSSEICSGFVDLKTMKFISDDCEFYLKQIIMLRHGDSECQQDNCKLTELGRSQANETAAFLFAMELHGFAAFSSPIRRCVETSLVIQRYCKLKFSLKQELTKQQLNESNESFKNRVRTTLDELPAKSLIVSHCDFIRNMLTLATGQEAPELVPNCSLTVIKDGKPLCIARKCNADDCKPQEYEPHKLPEGLEFV